MSWWQALLIGLLQGATELFPVSSLGHAAITPALFHWAYRPSDPSFVPFLVLLHLGTAGALLILYRDDWARMAVAFVRASARGRIETPVERMSMLVLVGTIPGGVIGFLLEHPIKALFGSPRLAALFLVLNGILLMGFELLRRRDEARRSARLEPQAREARYGEAGDLAFWQAAAVGACQALALLPGISRSGVTMGGGLLAGLRHREAARFSFLLATPIIAAAGILEVPQLLAAGADLGLYAVAAALAGAAAYLSARFLLRYFRSGRLTPYGVYCVAAGLAALALLR